MNEQKQQQLPWKIVFIQEQKTNQKKRPPQRNSSCNYNNKQRKRSIFSFFFFKWCAKNVCDRMCMHSRGTGFVCWKKITKRRLCMSISKNKIWVERGRQKYVNIYGTLKCRNQIYLIAVEFCCCCCFFLFFAKLSFEPNPSMPPYIPTVVVLFIGGIVIPIGIFIHKFLRNY